MASFNKVILLGNLTRDPEVRYTPKGSAVCDLGIAVNRVYTTDSGEKREEVTYVDVVLWARLAEIAGEPFLIWHLFRKLADLLSARPKSRRDQRVAGCA